MFNPNEPIYSQSAVVRFPTATADTRTIARGASCALESIYRQGYRYAKAGVMLMDIAPDGLVQQDLLFAADSKHSQMLMNTLDRINRKMGKRTLFFAAEGTQQSWAMRRNRTTQQYTTNWDELMIVR